MPGRTSLPPPHPALRASVVVPARNEEALIGSCLTALSEQESVPAEEYEVLLVLDRCTDGTRDRALEVAAEHPGLHLYLLEGPGRGAGHARRVGMEEALARLLYLNRPAGLIVSTDADTVVAPDWLSLQLEAAGRGARAIGGHIELRDEANLPHGVSGWRDEQDRLRQRELLSPLGHAGENTPMQTEHWRFSGASLALTAATYEEIGGLEPRAALEDEYLERALASRGIPIERPLAVKVATSARLTGRANRGLARDLALASWVRSNTYDARAFGPGDLLEKKCATGASVSIVVPMKGKGRGTAALLDAIAPLAETGLLDERIVLCPSDTNEYFVRGKDVKVYRDLDLMPGFGPVRGYGDALWRGLSVANGEIVLFLDPSMPDPEGRRALGLLGPLLSRQDLDFVKGFSTEPSDAGGAANLSELVARPLINLYRPELAGFVEPLSAEFAARRTLLRSLQFPVGYGAPLSLLFDATDVAGISALAQTRLGPRPPDHISLPDLSEAAYAILAAVTARTHGEESLDKHAPGPLFLPLPGRFESRRIAVEERPSLASRQPSAVSCQQARQNET
jgi:glucosyl-3-phosphoglycerate synthase